MFVTFLGVGVLCNAQTVEIRGFVTDSVTGEELPYATVFSKNLTFGAHSDDEGMYRINNVKAGTYTLCAAYIGYDTLFRVITVDTHQVLEVNLKLIEREKPNAIKIDVRCTTRTIRLSHFKVQSKPIGGRLYQYEPPKRLMPPQERRRMFPHSLKYRY